MCFITTFVEHPVWLGERKDETPEVWGQIAGGVACKAGTWVYLYGL